MKYRFVIILLIIFTAISIGFSYNLEKTSADYLYLTVHNAGQEEVFHVWKNEDAKYYIFLPAYAELESSQLNSGFNSNLYLDGKKVNKEYPCSDLEVSVSYSLVYYVCGMKKETTLTFLKSQNLSALHIDTESGTMDFIHSFRENKEKASARIYSSDGVVTYSGALHSISGRGNSTWNEYPKKPYNIELEKPADLLDMGTAEKWVLLANASDSSHMKNKIVYDYAQKMGMQYTPECRWVDLYLNGSYAGLYLLCEKIQIHPERVNIGYENTAIVSQEVEERLIDHGYPYIKTAGEQALRIRETDIPAEKLLDLWQSAENAIISESGIDYATGRMWYESIDLNSWARKYLLEEFFGNSDGGYCSQFFYIKDTCDKIYAGPVWDYDYSMYYSNAFYVNRICVKEGVKTPWYPALWNKLEFRLCVQKTYTEELKPLIQTLCQNELDFYSEQIASSADMDGIRWGKTPDSFKTGVSHIKSFLWSRMHFLETVWFSEAQYCYIQIDTRAGNNIEIHAINPGESLGPTINKIIAEDLDLVRWYDIKTNEEIDLTAPVENDMNIYAVWNTNGYNKYVPLILLILAFAVIMIVLLFNEVKHIWFEH